MNGKFIHDIICSFVYTKGLSHFVMLADDWNEELSSQMLQMGGRSRLKL